MRETKRRLPRACNYVDTNDLRLAANRPTDRPTDRPTERASERERERERDGVAKEKKEEEKPLATFTGCTRLRGRLSRSSSLPTESKPCAPDVSRVYPTIHRLLIPTQTSKRPLGPWRNQFKWLSVDVIDFHFTRLSGKTLHPPLPSPPPPLSLLPLPAPPPQPLLLLLLPPSPPPLSRTHRRAFHHARIYGAKSLSHASYVRQFEKKEKSFLSLSVFLREEIERKFDSFLISRRLQLEGTEGRREGERGGGKFRGG